MDPHERGLLRASERGARGAVRLIADHQVERLQPPRDLLRAGDHVD